MDNRLWVRVNGWYTGGYIKNKARVYMSSQVRGCMVEYHSTSELMNEQHTVEVRYNSTDVAKAVLELYDAPEIAEEMTIQLLSGGGSDYVNNATIGSAWNLGKDGNMVTFAAIAQEIGYELDNLPQFEAEMMELFERVHESDQMTTVSMIAAQFGISLTGHLVELDIIDHFGWQMCDSEDEYEKVDAKYNNSGRIQIGSANSRDMWYGKMGYTANSVPKDPQAWDFDVFVAYSANVHKGTVNVGVRECGDFNNEHTSAMTVAKR